MGDAADIAHRRLVDVARKALLKKNEPFSNTFGPVLAAVWRRSNSVHTCSLLRAWWLQRFHMESSTLPELDADNIAAVATRHPPLAVPPLSCVLHERAAFWADLFLAEHATAMWLLQQNAKGLGIGTAMVATTFLAQWPRPITHAYHYTFLRCFERPTYTSKWMTSFRKRWNATWKPLPSAAPLEPDLVRRKVANTHSPPCLSCLRLPLPHPYNQQTPCHTWSTSPPHTIGVGINYTRAHPEPCTFSNTNARHTCQCARIANRSVCS